MTEMIETDSSKTQAGSGEKMNWQLINLFDDFIEKYWYTFVGTNVEAQDRDETTTQNANRKPINVHFYNRYRICSRGFIFSAFKTNKKPPKRKKLKKQAEEGEESQAHENEDNFNGMPAPPPSKRQKKRQKKVEQSTRNKDKEIEKTIAYLTKWDTDRDEWKYEKLRQIYIQKNVFDETVIATEHIDVAIKYLSTSKVIFSMQYAILV